MKNNKILQQSRILPKKIILLKISNSFFQMNVKRIKNYKNKYVWNHIKIKNIKKKLLKKIIVLKMMVLKHKNKCKISKIIFKKLKKELKKSIKNK